MSMSDKRKILVAHRRKDQNSGTVKNLANDRLKRLRNTLNEEVEQSKSIKTFVNNRKRPISDAQQIRPSKITKQNENSFFRSIETHDEAMLTSQSTDEMEWVPDVNNTSEEENYFYIVVDTNIFISNLDLLKSIVNSDVPHKLKPILYVPWMVSEELDFMKSENRQTRCRIKAQEAIKFLEAGLSSNKTKMRGQSIKEYNDQITTGKNQDNKIIGCCLQVQQNHKNMILLTNDLNMKNKAHLNNIPVCSHNEILSKVRLKYESSKSEFVVNKMLDVCSRIIYECSAKAYGEDVIKHMDAFKTPPRTLQDCIKIFQKYWFTVFEEFLMKQFKKTVEDLSQFLDKHKNLELNFRQFLHLCKKMCVYLKDVENCKHLVESAMIDLNNIKES